MLEGYQMVSTLVVLLYVLLLTLHLLQTLRETELKRIRKKGQQINFVITEARFICEIFTISNCTYYGLL